MMQGNAESWYRDTLIFVATVIPFNMLKQNIFSGFDNNNKNILYFDWYYYVLWWIVMSRCNLADAYI